MRLRSARHRRPLAEHVNGGEAHHFLVILIEYTVAHQRGAPVGLGRRRLLQRHLADDAQRITGTDRLHPAQFVDPGRSHRSGFQIPGRVDQPERGAHGVKAAGDQTAVWAGVGIRHIDVERLRVPGLGEVEDLRFCQRHAGTFKGAPDREILEIEIFFLFHVCPPPKLSDGFRSP
jgi:hypothetical protein